jgi:hypothetical protein
MKEVAANETAEIDVSPYELFYIIVNVFLDVKCFLLSCYDIDGALPELTVLSECAAWTLLESEEYSRRCHP